MCSSDLALNQVLYNLSRRGPEWDLLPWQRQHRVATMAYSPLEQGRLLTHPGLQRLAKSFQMSTAQLALSWLLHQPDVIAIHKSAQPARVREFAQAAALSLEREQLDQLDELFSPPTSATPLEML